MSFFVPFTTGTTSELPDIQNNKTIKVSEIPATFGSRKLALCGLPVLVIARKYCYWSHSNQVRLPLRWRVT